MLTRAATYFNFFNFLLACPKTRTGNWGVEELGSATPQPEQRLTQT
jgi:hypothetical protein